MNRFIAAAASLLLVTGCESVMSPTASEVRVLTAVESVPMPEGGVASIGFTVTNDTYRTVYVSRCGGAISSELLRQVDGAWQSVSSAMCPANLDMSPVPLPARASVDGTRVVVEPGEYRLRVGVASSYSTTPAWYTLSNVFVIE